VRRTGRAAALGLVSMTALGRRGRPLSVSTLAAIRRMVPIENAVVPRRRGYLGSAATLSNRRLAEMLGDVELGGWTLDAGTINFLERAVRERQPDLVLEFGSGVSTVCLTHFMRDLHGAVDRPLVVSIDEQYDHAEQTTARLRDLELAPSAVAVFAPLVDQVIEGVVTSCYKMPFSELNPMLENRRARLVLVDGPSLPSGGSRFGTVPLARDLIAEGATIFLDDARRDSELTVAAEWRRRLPWLEIRGVHLVGKGLLEAEVTARDG